MAAGGGEDLSTAVYFDEAVAYVRSLPEKPRAGDADPPTTEQRLAFYALYKQARVHRQQRGAAARR
jgi:hypothetical protein